jgi:hypothetical protein
MISQYFQPDAERERDYRDDNERRRLLELTESKL